MFQTGGQDLRGGFGGGEGGMEIRLKGGLNNGGEFLMIEPVMFEVKPITATVSFGVVD